MMSNRPYTPRCEAGGASTFVLDCGRCDELSAPDGSGLMTWTIWMQVCALRGPKRGFWEFSSFVWVDNYVSMKSVTILTWSLITPWVKTIMSFR